MPLTTPPDDNDENGQHDPCVSAMLRRQHTHTHTQKQKAGGFKLKEIISEFDLLQLCKATTITSNDTDRPEQTV